MANPTMTVPLSSYPWLAIDFRAQPAAYLKAVFDYVLEGNGEVDWVVQNNRVRTWYHTPWMHNGPKGREFVRGLTRERTTPRPATSGAGELGPLQIVVLPELGGGDFRTSRAATSPARYGPTRSRRIRARACSPWAR